MQRWNAVAIVGVGLIGGSIGLALRKRDLAARVIGIGRRESTLARAQALGCITEWTTSLTEGSQQAEIIVVCTPVELVPEQVSEIARHMPPDSLITDVGSTKRELVAACESLLSGPFPGNVPFIGSHPLAGSEKTGPESARANLLEGRVVVITPTGRSSSQAATTIDEFWQSLGARTVRMTPADHDAALARTSHLPHVVSTALAAATPESLLPLTAGGWLDTTRIAAGDVELWRQILSANRADTLKALGDFETVLARLRAALESNDGPALSALLAEGKRRRDAVGS